jgi:hypothetical protein
VLLRTQLTNDFFHFILPSNCNEIRIETSIFATSPLLFSPATELARSQPVCTLNRHLHQPSLPCEDYDSSQKNDTGIHDERPTHTVASSLDSSQSQHNKFPPNQNKITPTFVVKPAPPFPVDECERQLQLRAAGKEREIAPPSPTDHCGTVTQRRPEDC